MRSCVIFLFSSFKENTVHETQEGMSCLYLVSRARDWDKKTREGLATTESDKKINIAISVQLEMERSCLPGEETQRRSREKEETKSTEKTMTSETSSSFFINKLIIRVSWRRWWQAIPSSILLFRSFFFFFFCLPIELQLLSCLRKKKRLRWHTKISLLYLLLLLLLLRVERRFKGKSDVKSSEGATQ